MIGLDTNVLVRYLAQDDVKQAAAATRLIEKELTASRKGFISLVVLSELCWVLSSIYSATTEELVATVQDLLNTPQFQVERREAVQAAIARLKASPTRKAGLVDALIASIADGGGCTGTVTFDKAAVRAAGMTLLV
jgi:predicted nucleic-acid-binding protein